MPFWISFSSVSRIAALGDTSTVCWNTSKLSWWMLVCLAVTSRGTQAAFEKDGGSSSWQYRKQKTRTSFIKTFFLMDRILLCSSPCTWPVMQKHQPGRRWWRAEKSTLPSGMRPGKPPAAGPAPQVCESSSSKAENTSQAVRLIRCVCLSTRMCKDILRDLKMRKGPKQVGNGKRQEQLRCKMQHKCIRCYIYMTMHAG